MSNWMSYLNELYISMLPYLWVVHAIEMSSFVHWCESLIRLVDVQKAGRQSLRWSGRLSIKLSDSITIVAKGMG